MNNRIQLSRPSITDAELAAAERVLRSGWLVYGPENRAFEEELAAACGRRYAVAVSSGTAALHLVLLARQELAGPAAELLTPALTFPATANVAAFVARPPRVVLADVSPDTFGLPAETVRAWLAQKRGPCMLVHQFGCPAAPGLADDLDDDARAAVISDAACAIGSPPSLRGHAVCLSFHPRKLLTTGEGGAVLSDDEGFIEAVRGLRAHGLVPRAGSEVMDMPAPGLNYRLPEMGAAIGRVQLRRLPALLEAHRTIAAHYRARLQPAGLQLQADAPGRTWQTLAVVLPAGTDRMALRKELLEAGIETQIASYGLHRLAAYAQAPVFDAHGTLHAAASPALLPIAERLHARGLALPLHAELTHADIERVCDELLQRLRI